jgi:nitroimidazol reductase NimA-like FMN-containing flavoprotein (pyridoxamine 5'-phosphate oxidase superfamily)
MMPNEQHAAATTAEPPPRGIVSLSDEDCRALLARQRLCIVALVDGEEPYAVPVFYGFDGETVYLGVAEGRKTRVLDANARVFIVVTEVGPGDAWRSVTIAGYARSLTDPVERQRGIDVLVAHNRRVRAVHGIPDAAPRRRSGGRLLRIEGSHLSGRAFG